MVQTNALPHRAGAKVREDFLTPAWVRIPNHNAAFERWVLSGRPIATSISTSSLTTPNMATVDYRAMSVIDEVLAANEIYSRTHELRNLTPHLERSLAVLTCMDTRLSIRTLGLRTGDAHIIRNAGGIVTEDALRSLVVSHYLLGTQEIMVINHTDCGLMLTSEQDLRTRIQNRAGTAAVAPASMRSKISKKMYSTSSRSCARIHGFRRVLRFAASSTTLSAGVSVKSKTPDVRRLTPW